jgi:hypothetical protein
MPFAHADLRLRRNRPATRFDQDVLPLVEEVLEDIVPSDPDPSSRQHFDDLPEFNRLAFAALRAPMSQITIDNKYRPATAGKRLSALLSERDRGGVITRLSASSEYLRFGVLLHDRNVASPMQLRTLLVGAYGEGKYSAPSTRVFIAEGNSTQQTLPEKFPTRTAGYFGGAMYVLIGILAQRCRLESKNLRDQADELSPFEPDASPMPRPEFPANDDRVTVTKHSFKFIADIDVPFRGVFPRFAAASVREGRKALADMLRQRSTVLLNYASILQWYKRIIDAAVSQQPTSAEHIINESGAYMVKPLKRGYGHIATLREPIWKLVGRGEANSPKLTITIKKRS